MFVTYEYYAGTYMGSAISAGDFPRLSRIAFRYLDSITMGRIARADERTKQIAMDACCAMAEVQQRQDSGGEIASASNDGYSESYVTSGKTAEQRMYAVACAMLAHTGLLYRGMDSC